MSLLLDPQVQKALEPLIHAAPNGAESLATLDDHTIARILSHPDVVKVVTPTRFQIELAKVDESGYTVCDHTYTESHRIVVDSANPTMDLSGPVTRPMTFGASIFDVNFMMKRSHGDFFFIAYGSGDDLPRTIMVVVLDPAFG